MVINRFALIRLPIFDLIDFPRKKSCFMGRHNHAALQISVHRGSAAALDISVCRDWRAGILPRRRVQRSTQAAALQEWWISDWPALFRSAGRASQTTTRYPVMMLLRVLQAPSLSLGHSAHSSWGCSAMAGSVPVGCTSLFALRATCADSFAKK